MKQFIVDRHTSTTPKMDEVPNEKIPIYNSLADVESDLANLEAGQIVATKDAGGELSQPVDVVEEGNMHAVSSNAVFKNCPRFPDYSQLLQNGITNTGYTATEDCYVVFTYITVAPITSISLYIDNNDVSVMDTTLIDSSTKALSASFCGYVKKGQVVKCKIDGGFISLVSIKFYKLSN